MIPEVDVLGAVGTEPLAVFFARRQKSLLESAHQGDLRSQTVVRFSGQYFPDVFPAFANTERLTLIDPRQDSKHPLCSLALNLQEKTSGEIFFLTPVDYHQAVILTDKNNHSGFFPIFLNGQWPNIDQLLFTSTALKTVHAPVTLTISGLQQETHPTSLHKLNYTRAPDIEETHSPLMWLHLYSHFEHNSALVQGLRPKNHKLNSLWKRITLSCPPIDKHFLAQKNPGIINEWSLLKLLNTISLLSTQKALDTAGKLAFVLPGDPELTDLMFLANHAQIITRVIHALTTSL